MLNYWHHTRRFIAAALGCALLASNAWAYTDLEERIRELELGQAASEDATRNVIRDALSTLGSQINEFISLGGTLEVLTGWSEGMGVEPNECLLELNTLELDFEIVVNDWCLASVVVEYDNGGDLSVTTTDALERTVDRINVDTAYLVVGNTHRWPPFLIAGRQIVPFGISTGDPVADVLSIEDPLTVEVFETREDALLFGLSFPTPQQTAATPAVNAPIVRPLLFKPGISRLMEKFGYMPRRVAPGLNMVAAPPVPPKFNLAFHLFNGDTYGDKMGFSPGDHFGLTVGYRDSGTCGRTLSEIHEAASGWMERLCMWRVQVDVDYLNSVFDTNFLQWAYRPFLDQIGIVHGMAASVKSTFGPFGVIGEWNGAIGKAELVDANLSEFEICPSAWQISVVYQFDWHPWLHELGSEGSYLSLSFSKSCDLFGVMRDVEGELVRTGWVPRRRLVITYGEWVLDGLRLSLEYSWNQDYKLSQGGTGTCTSTGIGTVTYVW